MLARPVTTVIVAAVAAGLIVAGVAPVLAQTPPPSSPPTSPPITVPDKFGLKGGANNTGDSISADVETLGSSPAPGATGRRSPRPRIKRVSTVLPPPPVFMLDCGDPGSLEAPCGPAEPGSPPPGPKPVPRTPAEVARSVGQRTELPVPGIRTSPPNGADQLVNLPTWMWVENWQPQTASATEGGLSVMVTATPRKVVWKMGAGEPVPCTAGKPWNRALREEEQSSDCTYTYRRSSADQPELMYRASATMYYDVTWSATNGESGSLGPASTTTDFRMRVAEGQALVTG